MKFLVRIVPPLLVIGLGGCSLFSPDPVPPTQSTQVSTTMPNTGNGSTAPQGGENLLQLNPPNNAIITNAVGYTRTDRPLKMDFSNYLGYIPTLISIDYGVTQNSYNRYAPVVESYARMSVDVFNRDFPSMLGEKGLQIVGYYPNYPLTLQQSNALPAVFYSRVYITVKEFQGTTLNLTEEQIDLINRANDPRNKPQQEFPNKPVSVAEAARQLAEDTSDPALNNQNFQLGEAGRIPAEEQQEAVANELDPWRGVALPPKTPNSMTIAMRGEIMLIEPNSGEVLWAAGSLWRESVIDLTQGQFDQAVETYVYHHSLAMRDELLNHLQDVPSAVLSDYIEEMRLMKGLPLYPDAPQW